MIQWLVNQIYFLNHSLIKDFYLFLRSVTIYISIHPLNRLYLKAIQEMVKIKNDWI